MAGVLDSAFREAGGGSDQDDGDVSGEEEDGDDDDIISNTHRASHASGPVPGALLIETRVFLTTTVQGRALIISVLQMGKLRQADIR